MTVAMHLKRTHSGLGATFGFVGDESVPLHYGSAIKEHQHVRKKAGICDLSHRTKIEISGIHARQLLFPLVTGDTESHGSYCAFLHNSGLLMSDAYVHTEENFIMVDAPHETRADLREHIKRHIPKSDCEVADRSNDLCLFTVQGPRSHAVASKLTKGQIDNMQELELISFRIGKYLIMASKKSRTGEKGFDIYCSKEHAKDIWHLLFRLDKDLKPFGMDALDTLQIEAGVPAWGREFDNTTPIWELSNSDDMILYSKHDFFGKNAVEHYRNQEEPARKLVGLEFRECLPGPQDQVLLFKDRIGEVKTAIKSPTLGKKIGFAYVAHRFSDTQERLEVLMRNRKTTAVVTPLPFYIAANRRL